MPQPGLAHSGAKYRADIDGLRAVAVLLVLGYHVRLFAYGGFIGVDVFFVISGYLISKVILTDLYADRFSLATFYERRVRRIAPALFVVLFATTILSYHYLTPPEIEEFAKSQLAALFSVSNIFFWKQTGYFDTPLGTKPLLHTWSLAVEEQFYFVFPLALMAIRRYAPHKLKLLIWLAALGSFALAVYFVSTNASAAFYLAPMRAWELLVGTIISQGYLPSIKRAAHRNLAALAGLLLIMLPGIRYSSETPFPGYAALPPCLGAALIIAAGEYGPSAIGRLLSLRPVVFIGSISYSLYLWHWPLLIFQQNSNMLFESITTRAEKLAFCAICIAVATMSWLLVERPFRTGRFRPDRPVLWRLAIGAASLVVGLSIAAASSHGFAGRFPPEARAIAAYTTYDRSASTRQGECFLVGDNTLADLKQDICLKQHAGRKSILLLGDSHAAMLLEGFRAAFPDRDILQANMAACPPLLLSPRKNQEACNAFNNYFFHNFLLTHHFDQLVLAARWLPEDIDQLTQTLNFTREHGIPTVVIGPTIEYDQGLARMIAIQMRKHQLEQVQQHRSRDMQKFDQQMATLAAAQWHVAYVSIYNALCTADCPLFAAPGVPLQYDSNHFTAEGSTLFARAMIAKGLFPTS